MVKRGVSFGNSVNEYIQSYRRDRRVTKVSKSVINYEKQIFAKPSSIDVKSLSKVLEFQKYDAITQHIVKHMLKAVGTFEQ